MIEVKVYHLDQVAAQLDNLAKASQACKPLMKAIAGTMESAVLTNFNQGGRPKWLGLKYREGAPLINTENLMGSITSDYDDDSAVVGTNEEYAAIHHFGGKAGRGLKVDIPARPFLTLTPQDEADISEDIQTYFQNLIK